MLAGHPASKLRVASREPDHTARVLPEPASDTRSAAAPACFGSARVKVAARARHAASGRGGTWR